MKLRNVLLGLAVVASALSLSSCYKNVSAEEAAKVLYANVQKEDPAYTKMVIVTKSEVLSIEVPDALKEQEEALKESLTENTTNETESALEIAVNKYAIGATEEDYVTAFTSLSNAKFALDGEKIKLSADVDQSLDEEGITITLKGTMEVELNEFGYITRNYSDADMVMSMFGVEIKAHVKSTITYSYSK